MEANIQPASAHLLCTQTAADRLGVSASFLNKLRCEGGGPVFVRLGRAVRYREADLHDWITARRFSSTTGHASTKVEA